MVLDFPVPVCVKIEIPLTGPAVHPCILFTDFHMDAELLGDRDPVDALVVFLGNGIVFGP